MQSIFAFSIQATVCGDITEAGEFRHDNVWPPAVADAVSFDWLSVTLMFLCFGCVIAALWVRRQHGRATWMTAAGLGCAAAWTGLTASRLSIAGFPSYSSHYYMAAGYFGFFTLVLCGFLAIAVLLFLLKVRAVIPTVVLSLSALISCFVAFGWSLFIYTYTHCF